MTRPLSLIVMDAAPLITLAAADALDCLTMAEVRVGIPDMVLLEVTMDLAKLGAGELIAWMRRNRGRVTLEPTEVFAEFSVVMSINPDTKWRNPGEWAASEVLDDALAKDPTSQAILFYEHTAVGRTKYFSTIPAGVTALTTGDLLHELEAAGQIQSASRILDAAAVRGRDGPRLRTDLSSPDARRVLRNALRAKGSGIGD